MLTLSPLPVSLSAARPRTRTSTHRVNRGTYLAQKKTPVGNCADPPPVFRSEAKDTKRKAQEEKKKVKKVAPGAGNTGGAAVKMGKAGGAGTIAPGRSSAPGKKSAR